IGSRVVVHSGTVIGSDGYGFVPEGGRHLKIPQVGVVQIDNDVEIGACNCIDRATFGRTWIQSGVKTDNQVHIGHNVTIGENSLLVAQVGIAGSVEVGRNVTLAGQAGVGGHIRIGDNAVIGPQAGVTRSVPEGRVVSGTPEMPHRQWLRVQRVIPRLPELKKRLDRLEAAMKKLAGRADDQEQET
ncbi:MAG TPA: UDP-3-O-(3-hydroxymyristoyl)glucosamine N-acyltransferase, partial [Desulfosalsimonadaceae bacterium]|nr:UDP-3-O-(3-hydroxymyristoyl)glucosamine N-acyltransferase [Desulfosalsimonadaceae bacterium]